jgi:hypothetical protein
VKERPGIAFGKLGGLLGVDDVVGNCCHLGSTFNGRQYATERKKDSHSLNLVFCFMDLKQFLNLRNRSVLFYSLI